MNIFDWLASFAKDKILHACLCETISLIGGVIGSLFGLDMPWVVVCAYCTGFAFGIGKELYDWYKYGKPEAGDWGADQVGIIMGTLFSALFTI